MHTSLRLLLPLAIISLIPAAVAGSIGITDLSNWQLVDFPGTQGGDGAALWQFNPDKTIATQTRNNDASILLSDSELQNGVIRGSWRVTGGDDDLVGFVFGYQDPQHFYLFDWKRTTQGSCGGIAQAGMSLKIVNSGTPLTCTDLWTTTGTSAVQLLEQINTIPWVQHENYYFTLTFQPGSFSIEIEDDDGTVIESWQGLDNTFAAGRYGFYVYSQDGFRAMVFDPCTGTDADGDGIPDPCDRWPTTDDPGVAMTLWAAWATSSSEYGILTNSYSAWQATSPPNAAGCGNHGNAWSPLVSGPNPEWLEARYPIPVHATGIVADKHQSGVDPAAFGYITRIELIDPGNLYHVIWEGVDSTSCAGNLFSPTWTPTQYPVIGVRLHTAVQGWEEIDAVGLVGAPVDLGPLPASPMHQEVGGRVVVEAEAFTGRQVADGRSWLRVLHENAGSPRVFGGYRGVGYLQSLPDLDTTVAGSGPRTAPYAEYRLRMNTPGTYQLYLRWDSHDDGSDSVYVSINELSDGAGGAIADWYRYGHWTDDANFQTSPWEGTAGRERTDAVGNETATLWDIAAPGDYTVRISVREDGAAVDAFAFQLASLSPPIDDDVDGDGYLATVDDCDDGDQESHPGALEICDGSDNDCDGAVDELLQGGQDGDGDGWTGCGNDCNDANPDVHPGAPEICDRLDNDCNGQADEVVDDPWKDSDGDGLYDCWELYGVDGDNPTPGRPTPQQVDIFLQNANRIRPDLFIELDYMQDALHSHAPSDAALAEIANKFWMYGKNEQGQQTGIVLHWLVDEAVNDVGGIDLADLNEIQYGQNSPTEPSDPAIACSDPHAHFGTSAERSQSNCPGIMRARHWTSRYGLLAHSHSNGDGGEARHPSYPAQCASTGFFTAGDQFERFTWILSGVANSQFDPLFVDQQAAGIMHELGHTLGLGHGGNTDANCKPNYLSIMSYGREYNHRGKAWKLPGVPDGSMVRINRDINYSTGALDTLYESVLDETTGIEGPTSQRILYGVFGQAYVGPSDDQVDWDGDGVFEDPTSGTYDINNVDVADCDGTNDTSGGVELDSLAGFDDWAQVGKCIRLPTVPADPNTLASEAPLQIEADITPQPELSAEEYLNAGLGTTDYDQDGVPNAVDVCVYVSDPVQEDLDADTYGDACDCASNDVTVWSAPSEVLRVVFRDHGTLTWEAPQFAGSAAPAYDTIRSAVPGNFSAAFCIENSDPVDQEAMDVQLPMPGSVYYYLVRARNDCPGGDGSLGTASNGAPRVGLTCP